MTTQERIEGFWTWFAEKSRFFLRAPSLEIIDELVEEISRIEDGISAEVSNRLANGDRELIVTSHGNASKFQLVSQIVSRSPQLTGWRIRALKPPRGFRFQVGGLEDLSIQDWHYVPLKSSPAFTEIGLRIEIPAQDCSSLDEATARSIVEEGVGEVLYSLIAHLEIDSSVTVDSIPIDSLAEKLRAWAINRGPLRVRRFLPDLGANSAK